MKLLLALKEASAILHVGFWKYYQKIRIVAIPIALTNDSRLNLHFAFNLKLKISGTLIC